MKFGFGDQNESSIKTSSRSTRYSIQTGESSFNCQAKGLNAQDNQSMLGCYHSQPLPMLCYRWLILPVEPPASIGHGSFLVFWCNHAF